MPAYHSSFNEGNFPNLGNMAVLPLKSKIRGPAPLMAESTNAFDIVDEAIDLFRANSFFKNFEIKGNADRVLIYLLLFIQECLAKVSKSLSYNEGAKALNIHALNNFVIPGDAGFPLNALYEKPVTRMDADNLRAYLSQLRQELANRLAMKVFDGDRPSKWWMSFTKRKFMNIPSVSGFQN